MANGTGAETPGPKEIGPLEGVKKDVKKSEPSKYEYYPECRDCGTRLTDTPFTDMNMAFVRTYICPVCGLENTFYIDLGRMYEND